jgi:hypothetical protein
MTYDPSHRANPEPKPSQEIFAWAFVKDVRTFTGSLRAVDDERWEVVYLADGNFYKLGTVSRNLRKTFRTAGLPVRTM